MIKKLFFTICMMLLPFSVLAQTYVNADGSENDILDTPILTTEEVEWVKENPTVTATAKINAAPLEFIRAGEPAGFSIDYTRLVASKVGLNVEFVTDQMWATLLTKLENREIDLSHNIVQTPDREKFLDYTPPYIELLPAVFGSSSHPAITNIEQLKGKRILVLKGWAATKQYLQKYPDLNLIDVNNSTEAMLAISEGTGDLFFLPRLIGQYIIDSEFIQNVKLLGNLGFMDIPNMDYVRMATRNDKPILNSIFQKGMLSVTVEEFEALKDKWFMPDGVQGDLLLTPSEEKWLAENPIVRVAVDPTILPVEFIDENGKISGISGSYLKILEERLGVKFEWVENSNFRQGLAMVLNKQADIITAISSSAEREKYIDFTEAYMTLDSVIFARGNEDVFVDMSGLIGKKVAQIAGFQVTNKIRQFDSRIDITEVATIPEALKMVSSGDVDAYVGSVPITSYNIAMENLTNIVAVGSTPYSSKVFMGIRPDLPYLSSAVRKAIDSITVQEKAEISRQWIMVEKAPEPDFSLIWQIVAAALIVILLFLIWNYSLRKEVAKRKSSEERFKQIAETVDGLFFILKPDMNGVEYISPNFEEWTKYSCAELYNDPFLWLQIVHPDDKNYYRNSVDRMLKSNFELSIPDYRIVHRDGSIRWISSQMHPVYDEAGNVKNVIGFSSDITQRKLSSSKLDEISNQFQNAFEYAAHGMALISIDGKFLRVNDALCQTLNYSKQELLNLNVMQITHKDDLKNRSAFMKDVLDGTRPSFEIEERHVRSDGSIIPVQFNASLVRDSEGKPIHFVAQFQDMSELKEREEQLRHSQKMDAVGQLTGGIAHDFNNILGIILGNLEILDSTIKAEDKQKNRLHKAIKSVDRGSNLIKKLLSFSRKSSPQRSVSSINDHIRNFQDFMGKSLGDKVKFETSLLDELWPAEIDGNEFEDAVLNICLNARDAMPSGGTFMIKTENVILNETYTSRVPDSKIGDHILISFSDTGEGIAPSIIDKVLEPFFTTKSVNKGTGLGLSMVHGFAQRSGGHLRIHSEIGSGTTINLYIPRSYHSYEVDDAFIPEQVPLPKGKEKILVLDDEVSLCEVAESQLKNLGYSVFSANDSETAIKLLKENEDIQLLFSDIVMPNDEDGYKVSKIARELNPSIRVLLTSGFADNVEMDSSTSEVNEELKRNMLVKPYNHQELAFAVRRTLDR